MSPYSICPRWDSKLRKMKNLFQSPVFYDEQILHVREMDAVCKCSLQFCFLLQIEKLGAPSPLQAASYHFPSFPMIILDTSPLYPLDYLEILKKLQCCKVTNVITVLLAKCWNYTESKTPALLQKVYYLKATGCTHSSYSTMQNQTLPKTELVHCTKHLVH